MSILQRQAVDEKVTNIGTGACDICHAVRLDCVRFEKNHFPLNIRVTICDSCNSYMLRKHVGYL